MMKKNLYLLLFLIGVLIIGVPQFRILQNEINMASQLNEYQEMVEVYPEQDLTVLTELLTQENQVTPEEIISDDTPETVIADPFTQDVAADDLKLTTELFHNGVLGYIAIPEIGEQLPLYNGATAYNLSLGAATVTGTSLPVGGESTHAVISAHRGYAGANYFRHIDLLNPGDKIFVVVLNNVFTYEVTGTQIVEADDASSLMVVSGEDLLTLLSCHPYMVNDKRILVHSKRIPTTEQVSIAVPSERNGNINVQAEEIVVNNSSPVNNRQPTTLTENETVQKVKILVAVTLKFTTETVSPSVRRSVLVNRIIVLFCIFAVTGILVLFINNLLKLRKK